jgi:hypothetical protein
MYADHALEAYNYFKSLPKNHTPASRECSLTRRQLKTHRRTSSSGASPAQVSTEAHELALEWMAERRHVRRLRAFLEGLPFKLGKEAPERLVIVPDHVQGLVRRSAGLASLGQRWASWPHS